MTEVDYKASDFEIEYNYFLHHLRNSQLLLLVCVSWPLLPQTHPHTIGSLESECFRPLRCNLSRSHTTQTPFCAQSYGLISQHLNQYRDDCLRLLC